MGTGRAPHRAPPGRSACRLACWCRQGAARGSPQQHITSAWVGGSCLAGSPWSTAASSERPPRWRY